MLDNRIYEKARLLSFAVVKTDWSNYDFEEKSAEWEKRVPKLVFDDKSVTNCYDMGIRTVEHDTGLKSYLVAYIRTYQVEYFNEFFEVEVATNLDEDGRVKKFTLKIYWMDREIHRKVLEETI